jgi:hypothetical protein
MSQRDYNQVYLLGPFILQIMQDGQHDGIAIDLLPTITLGMNNGKLIVGFALRWLCGDVNFGIMTKAFRESEWHRREIVAERADKMGVSPRQYALRWGW